MNIAPIVLFVYNRPWHTKQTVESLQKNELASDSELFIYSDEAKNEDARKSVNEVREYIDNTDGFKKVTVIKREKNWGLSNSIIDGVTKIVNEYGKIIVLEDDLITSPYFLKFMNEALEFYNPEKKVWHINGWNNPIETEQLDNVYLSKIAYSWGWATWSDRWGKFEKNPKKLIKEFPEKRRNEFNIDGYYDFWEQIIANKEGKMQTWAVFWYAIIFMNDGLCLTNNLNLVKNIGTDGSGQNCGVNLVYKNQNIESSPEYFIFNKKIEENQMAKKRLKEFIFNTQNSFSIRLKAKLKKWLA